MIIYPVYVPSKGRALTATSPDVLLAAKVPFFLVVEQQDFAAYADRFGASNVLVLPEENQGIAFVRNWIHARNTDWYWMLDDDITSFFTAPTGKNEKVSAAAALMGAQAIFNGAPQVGQAALEYQQFAWRAKKHFVTTSYCDVCVAIHGGRTSKLNYRKEVNLKEDRDFTLQVLAAGMETVRVQRYSFGAPANGSNAGGLKELYAQAGREAEAAQRLAAMWGPEIVEAVTKPNGRQDAKIHWSFFKKARGKK